LITVRFRDMLIVVERRAQVGQHVLALRAVNRQNKLDNCLRTSKLVNSF
jgi:hypothetical protein